LIFDQNFEIDLFTGGDQPGQPRVKLVPRSQRRHISRVVSNDFEAVSDNVQLKWSPCSRLRKDDAYEIEMWDLGLQVLIFFYIC